MKIACLLSPNGGLLSLKEPLLSPEFKNIFYKYIILLYIIYIGDSGDSGDSKKTIRMNRVPFSLFSYSFIYM